MRSGWAFCCALQFMTWVMYARCHLHAYINAVMCVHVWLMLFCLNMYQWTISHHFFPINKSNMKWLFNIKGYGRLRPKPHCAFSHASIGCFSWLSILMKNSSLFLPPRWRGKKRARERSTEKVEKWASHESHIIPETIQIFHPAPPPFKYFTMAALKYCYRNL